MVHNISIIGGDLRIVYLAKMLTKENYKIHVFGLENSKEINEDNDIKKCNSLEEALEKSNIIVSAIPFSKEGIKLNMPLSNNKISVEEFISKAKSKTLIAGNINSNVEENMKIIDLMKIEELVVYNTIATAEGTIQIAMEETNKTIYNSNVLVLGFGRVGKTVAERFNEIKANVFCEARKKEDIAWIKTYGYNSIELKELKQSIHKFDIIINTIPAKIINEEELKLIKKDCLIIDLASNPGGIDFEKAKEYGIKIIHALGLPGKVAPYTSAEFIKEIIKEYSKEI